MATNEKHSNDIELSEKQENGNVATAAVLGIKEGIGTNKIGKRERRTELENWLALVGENVNKYSEFKDFFCFFLICSKTLDRIKAK